MLSDYHPRLNDSVGQAGDVKKIGLTALKENTICHR